MLEKLGHTLRMDEVGMLSNLRSKRRRNRQKEAPAVERPPLGQRVSDGVASTVGSWRFIIIQSVILAIWMTLNATAYVYHWDPYPFILLNLVLSFQAAYTAPFIMMSQNRQNDIDRLAAKHDYDINLKAELELELLHQKFDTLREQEIAKLLEIILVMQAELCHTRKDPNSAGDA
jgi:uncharacterized membrane protein